MAGRGVNKPMRWQEYRKKLLKDPEFRREYEALEPEFQLACKLIRVRLEAEMTQAELARAVGTKQPSIARIESGTQNVKLATLKKIARALGCEVRIELVRKPTTRASASASRAARRRGVPSEAPAAVYRIAAKRVPARKRVVGARRTRTSD